MAVIAAYKQKGDVINFTASADIAYHEIVAIGTMAGIALEAIAKGESGAVAIAGIFDVPTTASDIAAGDTVYFDTKTGAAKTGTVVLGVATEAAADGFVSVKIGK
jgi:predicted RecA/RadA family phage recombinase